MSRLRRLLRLEMQSDMLVDMTAANITGQGKAPADFTVGTPM